MSGLRYHANDAYGVSRIAPNAKEMREILDSLDQEDAGEEDVSLVHESGWTLTLFQSGILVYENLNRPIEAHPRFLATGTREEALGYWRLLAAGKLTELDALPWQRAK